MPAFPPVSHVAVTVSDRARSQKWYATLFDADPALDENTGDFHHVVWALGETLFGIHTHGDKPAGNTFDETTLGLDHVAFGVSSRVELETWEARLDELGISHGGIVDADYGSGLSFRDPDNITLEIFAPPSE